MGTDEVERPAVQGKERHLRQSPAEAGCSKTEGRRRRNDDHLRGWDAGGKQRADAVLERVARSEHADAPAATGEDRLGRAIERARPPPGCAANQACGESKMPLP